MVLKIRLILLLSLFACSLCNAYIIESIITDNAVVGEYSLTLSAKDKVCKLKLTSTDEVQTFNLFPKPPCYFLRRGSEEPQSVAYSDVGVLNTLLVIGSPVSIANQKNGILIVQ